MQRASLNLEDIGIWCRSKKGDHFSKVKTEYQVQTSCVVSPYTCVATKIFPRLFLEGSSNQERI